MGVFEWAERRSDALTIWDIGVLKILCVLFGIVVGAYRSHIVMEHVWWFVAPMLIFGGVSVYRWFTVEPR